jgi:hypothetical protein
MQADALVGGRLAEVLAEMQDVQQDECVVCMDRPCSITLEPCGHRVLPICARATTRCAWGEATAWGAHSAS